MTNSIFQLLCGQVCGMLARPMTAPASVPSMPAWDFADRAPARRPAATAGGTLTIAPRLTHLSHDDAEAICRQIRAATAFRSVIVDLRDVTDATTAAFAKLVLLRRELLRDGRDLHLRGLKSRAASVWRISRLGSVLPLQ